MLGVMNALWMVRACVIRNLVLDPLEGFVTEKLKCTRFQGLLRPLSLVEIECLHLTCSYRGFELTLGL